MKTKRFKVIEMYKALGENETLLPNTTGFAWWTGSYEVSEAEYDREFARRFSDFEYFDFLEGDDLDEAIVNFHNDVLSILTFNQKKYAEMYRIFVATDAQIPFDYNYDMTETYGKTKTTSVYGSHTDTIGQVQDTHSVAPFNSTVPQVESQDTTAQRSDTIGGHTDTVDGDAVTNTRKGNIGVQTAGDIARVFTDFWNNHYKFMSMIFDDICKQLLMIGD